MDALLWISLVLIVFMAVGAIGVIWIRQYFNQKKQYAAFIRRFDRPAAVPVEKLASYERYGLLMERISIPQLLMRMADIRESPEALVHALIMAIQQEFDFLSSQQVFVSDELWKILVTAKNQVIDLIYGIAKEKRYETVDALRLALLRRWDELEKKPTEIAQSAIRAEMKLYTG